MPCMKGAFWLFRVIHPWVPFNFMHPQVPLNFPPLSRRQFHELSGRALQESNHDSKPSVKTVLPLHRACWTWLGHLHHIIGGHNTQEKGCRQAGSKHPGDPDTKWKPNRNQAETKETKHTHTHRSQTEPTGHGKRLPETFWCCHTSLSGRAGLCCAQSVRVAGFV